MYNCTFLCCDMSHSGNTISPYAGITSDSSDGSFVDNNISAIFKTAI